MSFNRITVIAALALTVLTSCDSHREDKAYYDFLLHIDRENESYCSPDIAVAKRGLLAAKDWFSNQQFAGTRGFTYDLELTKINGRLFLIHEFLGETNVAEMYYEESVRVYDRYLRSKGMPHYNMPKLRLREMLRHQENTLDVAWRTNAPRVAQ